MTDLPQHTVEDAGPGSFVVKLGRDVVGTVAEDHEYPGLWTAWDQRGQFLGRLASWEAAVAFVAAWIIAEKQH